MKKVLFATTALVMAAGASYAELKLGGDARVGVLFNSAAADEISITNRFTLNIDGSATADNGLEAGVRVRMRADNGAAVVANAARIYLRSGGLTLATGNIWGAMDSMPGLYSGSVGLTGLGWGNVVTGFNTHGYSSTGVGHAPEGLEVMFSAGSVGVHVSNADDRTELAAAFSFGDWTIGAAVSDQDSAGADWVLTAGGALGNFNLGLAAAGFDAGTNITLSGSASIGAATTLNLYVAQVGTAADQTNAGIGIVHNMGGGVSLRGGVAMLGDDTRADIGVNFVY
jgi:outer membrane protein OmpU